MRAFTIFLIAIGVAFILCVALFAYLTVYRVEPVASENRASLHHAAATPVFLTIGK
ncbi:hypothetical protein [Brucella sp. IR073]|uniref:hypothetical protein n=1 Tax=unclassified Brucella TaxID=2632610 RepID=UPI003B97F7E0